MAVRFPLFSDADVRGQVVKGLIRRGWDVVRVIDAYPKGRTKDPIVFENAAKEGRVLVTTDKDMLTIAHRWLEEDRPFRMVTWKQEHHREMSDGDIIQGFEELAAEKDPFIYPIRHIKPKK